MTKYDVIKTLPSQPGPGLRTSQPGREVVMSSHRSEAAAERAAAKYDRDHRGYATFRVVAR